MAQSYDRRINLYINIDGKQINNNVKSIRGEMSKLTNQQAQMTIGSKEYVDQAKKIQFLKGILNQHNADLSKLNKSWSFKGMAEGFNKYFGIVAAGIATVTGIIYSMNAATKAANDFEEKLANLGAITGLTGNSLEWMGNKAKEMSTSTLEGGIHITKTADEIVDAFTKMGSARPELLKNKEALAQVTEKALILAEASKMEMQPAIEAVAASMNQFNLGAEESGRIINVLGAGSVEGSAEVGDLTDSLKNVGTVAASSNMTLEQTVAALEVLGEKQLKGVEAGTKLRGALLKLKEAGVGYASGQFNMRDALIEANKKLEEQSGSIEKDALKLKLFGIENITAGDILLQNIEKYDKLTIAVTGTDVAIQQAAKNTATNAALMAQAKNEFHNAAIELGKNLSPAMTVLYQVAGSVARSFSKMITDSPAEALAKEGILVNRLATELANSNTPLERRKTILTEIKEINPKIAEGLDAENLNYKTLTGNIQAYNAELSNRILLENLSEDEKKFATKVAKYKQQFGELQVGILEVISRTDQGIALSNLSLEEKIAKTYDVLKEKAAGYIQTTITGAAIDYRNQESKDLTQLGYLISKSTDAQNNLNEAQGKEIDFSKRTAELKKILGIQENINAAAGGNPPPSNPPGGNSPPDNGNGGKITDPGTEKATTDALELAYKEQQVLLKDKYEGEETLQKEYKARMLANELAYIMAKQALTNDDATYLDLQSQYIDKQREYTAALKEATPELLLNRDGINQQNASLLEEAKLLGLVAQKQAEGSDATEELRIKTEKQRDMILGSADALGQALYDLASGGEDALKNAAKTMINFALDMLKVQVEIAIAKATIESLTQPDSIATFGVSGFIRAAVMVGLIEAAFAGVKGLVNGAFLTGGYTGSGNKNEVAGQVHKGEYVIPKKILDTPLGAAYAANLEAMRTNPVTVTQAAVQASKSNRSSTGINSVTSTSSTDKPEVIIPGASSDPSLTDAINLNTKAIALLMKRGVSFPMVAGIKKMKEVEDLLNQTGMGGFGK